MDIKVLSPLAEDAYLKFQPLFVFFWVNSTRLRRIQPAFEETPIKYRRRRRRVDSYSPARDPAFRWAASSASHANTIPVRVLLRCCRFGGIARFQDVTRCENFSTWR